MKEDPFESQRCAKQPAALAAPERLRVIHFLRDGPRNVTEIADMLSTLAVNVSHHMNVLLVAGLVRREKRGRFVLYALAPGVFKEDDQEGHGRLNLGCCRLELPVGDGPPARGD